MSPAHLFVGRMAMFCMGAALIGLFVKHRWRLWYTFALLLLIVSVHDSLVALWPAQFHRNQVWRAKETVLILVRLAMVVELAIRVFRGFPGALAAARRLLLVICASTFLAVLALPVRRGGHEGFVGEIMPRVLNGTIWLFAALAVLILWYRLPVHWFQKAILLSYVPYLLVFTVAMNMLGDLGWQRAAWADTLSVVAYLLLLLYWTYTAWRRDPVTRGPAGPRVTA
ncbi:MAG TPA: hypothetical protein VMT87_08785 [Vicinamibacteria bacterium]|nr:hypothetical protein [Vicinamibacteria bacterium]